MAALVFDESAPGFTLANNIVIEDSEDEDEPGSTLANAIMIEDSEDEDELYHFANIVLGARGTAQTMDEGYLIRCVCAGGIDFTVEKCKQLLLQWAQMDFNDSLRRFNVGIFLCHGGKVYFSP